MSQIDLITGFLKGRLSQTAKGYVVGVSGGLDSAVVAALCSRIDAHLVLVALPCQSSDSAFEDAQLVAEHLGVSLLLADLGRTHDMIVAATGIDYDKLAAGNIRSRLRMVALYAYANQLGLLVAGTSNLTEMTLGYFTKYGDGGVDVEPIAHLAKYEVRGLARELGIPKRIIEKAPSADLWKGQTDERELGFSYDDLDGAVLRLLYQDRAEEMPYGLPSTTPEAMAFVVKAYERTYHKRLPIPSIKR
jgi:NAD+ synthase